MESEQEIKDRLIALLNREIENEFDDDEMPETYAVAIEPKFRDMVVCFDGDYPWHEAALDWVVLTSSTYAGIVREIKICVHSKFKK